MKTYFKPLHMNFLKNVSDHQAHFNVKDNVLTVKHGVTAFRLMEF